MNDVSPLALNRLLAKLDHRLGPDGDPRLYTSPYERNRVGANLEHARTLLLTLERQSTSIRVQAQRDHAQSELQTKREAIKKLNVRLEEITQNAEDEDGNGDEDEDGDGAEDLLNTYAPARKGVKSGIDTGGGRPPSQLDPSANVSHDAATNELRPRRALQATDNLAAATTTAREDLFRGRSGGSGVAPSSEVERTQALMSHNRTEQETLTTGLLGLARALKESSVQFGASLEAEKDVLKRTEGGLDKSTLGMEAAERKMGTLRKMSEGQGWWGRIKLYAFIFALWVACFLLVFVGPKLRF